ncbi:MAG: hypothetical protein IJI10_10985 [Eubacterium sp.]|nr:hypothetical protein [Eubacterium sp.]
MKKRIRRCVSILAAVTVLVSSAVICSAAPANTSGSTSSAGQNTSSTSSAGQNTTGTAQNVTPAKKVKVKGQTFTLRTDLIKKKAAAVKVGTTDLTFKKDEGYLKFVSKKTRLYSFRISSFLTKKKGIATVMFQAPDSDDPAFSYLISIKNGTKVKEALELKTRKTSAAKRKAVADGKTFSGKTVKMRLKKGQAVYIYVGSDYKKMTARLQII